MEEANFDDQYEWHSKRAEQEDLMVTIDNVGYDDLEIVEEEMEQFNHYYDEDVHLHMHEEESFNRIVELLVQDDIVLQAAVVDYDYLREYLSRN